MVSCTVNTPPPPLDFAQMGYSNGYMAGCENLVLYQDHTLNLIIIVILNTFLPDSVLKLRGKFT